MSAIDAAFPEQTD